MFSLVGKNGFLELEDDACVFRGFFHVDESSSPVCPEGGAADARPRASPAARLGMPCRKICLCHCPILLNVLCCFASLICFSGLSAKSFRLNKQPAFSFKTKSTIKTEDPQANPIFPYGSSFQENL